MPYANNQGVRIHYQIEGKGPALVLQHEFTDSLESWYELGYVNALKQDYRLILEAVVKFLMPTDSTTGESCSSGSSQRYWRSIFHSLDYGDGH
jgi:hypothetical protein